MTLNDALIAVVRQLVEDKGMTFTGLARVSGISRHTLQNYINRDNRTMPIDVVDNIAGGLGMSSYELLLLAEELRDAAAIPK